MSVGWRTVCRFAAALCCTGLASCASVHHQESAPPSTAPTTVTSPPTAGAAPPAVVVARPYSFNEPEVGPQLPFGAAIPASDIGEQSAEVGGVTYGLANQGVLGSVSYPAISHDGGHTWAIDGPIFYIAAADGSAAVSTITAVSATMAYAWGATGNLVRITTDGGHQWSSASFYNGVVQASYNNGVFTAIIYSENTNKPTYISGDGGRTWQLQPTPSS
jgi:hypothetical protein